MSVAALPGVSDAPITAIARGSKNRSRSSSRSSTGRPVTSTRTSDTQLLQAERDFSDGVSEQ